MIKLIKSQAFRRGFAEGISAPLFVFAPGDYSRSRAYDSSVAAAWRDVGEALTTALLAETREIDEITHEEKPGFSKARNGKSKTNRPQSSAA